MKEKKYKWILASASPRRKEILGMMIDDFKIVVSEAKELTDKEKPEEIVEDLARLKGEAVLKNADCDEIVVAADTLVFCGNEILGKPHDKEEARRMIRMISGREHNVCTGVFVGVKKSDGSVAKDSFSVLSTVHVDELSEAETEEYISGPEPYDKAGAYAIQGLFGKHISGIEGDYLNIVGFPANRFYRLCKDRGYL